MEKVSVIIVNWNTGELLARCVQSLAALPEGERALLDEVIVVDNASHDRSLVQAQTVVGKAVNNPPVRFIRLEKNVGFAGGNNVAWRRISERHGNALPHLLLLNPDTEVRPEALPALLQVFAQHTRAGIVGPRLLNPDGSLQPSVRQLPTLGVFVWLFLKLHRLWPHSSLWRRYLQTDFDYSREQQVPQVMGAAFLIRNTTAAELGMLDERFFVWFEEVDYCQRAAQASWEVWYTPSGMVTHHGGVSFGQLIGWRRALPWLTSGRQYAAKHLGRYATVLLSILTPIALLLALPAGMYHRRTKS